MLKPNTPILFDVETKQALLTIASRMDALIESIDRASTSADRSARWLVALTVVLVLLTVAIAVLKPDRDELAFACTAKVLQVEAGEIAD